MLNSLIITNGQRYTPYLIFNIKFYLLDDTHRIFIFVFPLFIFLFVWIFKFHFFVKNF